MSVYLDGGVVPRPLSRWRHLDRKTTYWIVGVAIVQARPGPTLDEGIDLMIYRSFGSGRLWARPVSEFLDGRFEPAPSRLWSCAAAVLRWTPEPMRTWLGLSAGVATYLLVDLWHRAE